MKGTIVSESGQSQKWRVMIVDDEADVLEMLATLVTKMGHESIPVGKARDALGQIERGKADLLLLDLNMPGATGLDMLKVLRRRRLMIPTVIVSAHVSSDIAQQLAELSISGIVAKPFKKDRLEAEILKALGGPPRG